MTVEEKDAIGTVGPNRRASHATWLSRLFRVRAVPELAEPEIHALALA